MCCRTTIEPLDIDVARAVLLVGQFVPNANATEFVRALEEEGAKVTATFEQNALRLSITPAITSLDGHNGKRITAGVYFELAAKYAEKVGGKVTQLSNVAACAGQGGQNKVLAVYPDQPLNWEAICMGFAEVIAGGHVHDDYDEPIAY